MPSSSYYAQECTICGATPWYRIGKHAFCRIHKSHAVALRKAAAAFLNLDEARANGEFKRKDIGRQSSERHHHATGRKSR